MRLEQPSSARWRDLAAGCRFDTVYQDPRWLELIESVYPRLGVHRLACFDDAGRLLWMLPLVALTPLGKWRPMLISLPFGSYGGFLWPKGKSKTLARDSLELLRGFFSDHHSFALEVRDLAGPVPVFAVNDQCRRFEKDLAGGPEALWRGISGNARTGVRKADKLGVEVVFDHPDAFAIFRDLNERHAAFHGTPLHAKNWYPRLRQGFDGQVEIVVAVHEGVMAGALFVLYSGDRAVLHAAVSRPEARRLPVMDRLVWAILDRLAQTEQVRWFDFGRTRPDAGQLFFKRKWNGRETPVYHSYLLKEGASVPWLLPDNPRLSPAIAVWRHLPRWLHRQLGPLVRVRIPA